jgi:hypothetical protein
VDDQATTRTSGGTIVKRIRFSLRAAFLLITVIAVLLPGANAVYRKITARKPNVAVVYLQRRYDLLAADLKQKIAANPGNASEVEAQLMKLDADYEVARRELSMPIILPLNLPVPAVEESIGSCCKSVKRSRKDGQRID